MSISVMSAVWKHSSNKGSTLLLLLAIADFANDEGIAWPSVGTLAKKIRMKERNTQILIKKLEASGELRVQHEAGPHGTNLYEIVGGANFAGVQKTAKGGAKNSTRGVQANAPKPSVNPLIEPSLKEDIYSEPQNPLPSEDEQPKPPKVEAPKPDPLYEHPAVIGAQARVDVRLTKRQLELIADRVPGTQARAFLFIMDKWIGKGYRQNDIEGMLQWWEAYLKDGSKPWEWNGKANGNGNHNGRGKPQQSNQIPVGRGWSGKNKEAR